MAILALNKGINTENRGYDFHNLGRMLHENHAFLLSPLHWDFLKLNKFSLGIWPYLPIQRPEPRHINFNFGRGIHEHYNYAFSFSQKQMNESIQVFLKIEDL